MSNQRIKVMFVDDSADITRLYARMLSMQDDMECVATFLRADEMMDEVKRKPPEVIVIDLTMPGRDPLDAIMELRRVSPEVRTIAFSGYDDPATIAAAKSAGAAATASKNGDPFALLDIIRIVAAECALSSASTAELKPRNRIEHEAKSQSG